MSTNCLRARLIAAAALIAALAGIANPALGQDGGYRVFRPTGAGPHPAVVFVSGCSGFTPGFAPQAYERPAKALNDLGYLVVWADYLKPRGLSSCAVGGVTPADAGKDAVAAAAWLRAQPNVDAARIYALGWSYGGGGVLAAVADHDAGRIIFSRAAVYYPYCSGMRPGKAGIPLLVLIGGEDNVAPGRLCTAALSSSAGADRIKQVVYPGARHGFDVRELPARMDYAFGTLGHDPQAATAAWEEIVAFFAAGR